MPGDIYQDLFSAYKKAYPNLKPSQAQANVNKLWKSAKEKYNKKTEFTSYVQKTIDELKVKATNVKVGGLSSFLQKVSRASCSYKKMDGGLGRYRKIS